MSRSRPPAVLGRPEAARPEPSSLTKLRPSYALRSLRHRIDSLRFGRGLVVKPCPGLVRLGSKYGGWTVPDGALHAQAVCYLAGVGEDISFDLAVVDRYGCTVFALDPTPLAADFVAETASDEPRFVFLEYGIWASDGELRLYAHKDDRDSSYSGINLWQTSEYVTAPVRSLRSIMADLGHERIDLLKLDIEGAEYAVLGSMLEDGPEVSVVCVEFHGRAPWTEARTLLEQLEASGYAIVSRSGFEVTLVQAALLDALAGARTESPHPAHRAPRAR